MAYRISNIQILELAGKSESLRPTVIHKYATGVIAVNRDKDQLDLLRDIAIKLSVAAQERGFDTAAIDAVATDPVRATPANWDAADVTIGKLKIVAHGVAPKSQNRVNKRTKSPTKPELPLEIPAISFMYRKASGSAAEKERKAERWPIAKCIEQAAPGPADLVSDAGIANSIATNLREPPQKAFAAYRAHRVLGQKQADVATELKVNQGQISRWVKQVATWIAGGNVLPNLDVLGLTTKPISVDPVVIDMGKRQDGRAKNQRAKNDD